MMKENLPRDDYYEFLNLVLLFLGEKAEMSKKTVLIRSPGAFHHARWMAKAIYSLKIFILRKEFALSPHQQKGLRQICIFIVGVYTEAWFSAPSAIKAPNTDFTFLSKLQEYEKIDAGISQIALKKFKNHLWYLGSESIAFAFFDDNVSDNTKKKMKAAMKNNNAKIVKKANLKNQTIPETANKGLEQFVSSKTARFFERFNVDTAFLESDPSTWSTNDAYKRAVINVRNLKVVNDVAERGVKLIEDYNLILTKNEEQKQYLLQVVTDYRKRFPDVNKRTLSQIL